MVSKQLHHKPLVDSKLTCGPVGPGWPTCPEIPVGPEAYDLISS
jgi:hypothetical protein